MSTAIKLKTSMDLTVVAFMPVIAALVVCTPLVMMSFGWLSPIAGINHVLLTIIALTALVAFCVLGFAYIRKIAKRHAADLLAAELQIQSILTEKYGIELVEPVVSLHRDSGNMSVSKHGARAKNANGEDVLASIRLINNSTDLVAYSNGKEFERVDQPVAV